MRTFWQGLTRPGLLAAATMLVVAVVLAAVSLQVSLAEDVPPRHVLLKENERGAQEVRRIHGKEFMFQTDREGYVVPSALFPDPDLRIAFLGGSNTECRNLPSPHRWPLLTAQMLSGQLQEKVDLLVDGHSGCTARDAFELLYNKTIHHGPDVIVVMLGYNDLIENFIRGGSYPRLVEGLDLSDKTLYRAALRMFSMGQSWLPEPAPRQAADGFAPAPAKAMKFYDLPPDAFDRAIADFEDNLRLLARYAHIKGKPIYFMTFTSLYGNPEAYNDPEARMASMRYKDGVASYASMAEGIRRVNDTIRRVATEEPGAHLVDIENLVPPTLDNLFDEVHFTEQGSQRIAEALARALRENERPNAP